ncbi:unnamed protein product [Camellia sinensis]
MSTTQGLGEHTVRVSTTVALSRVGMSSISPSLSFSLCACVCVSLSSSLCLLRFGANYFLHFAHYLTLNRGIWGFIGIKLERGIRIQGLRVLIKNWIEGSNQKRELFQDLDPLLSNTFGTITALLQVCFILFIIIFCNQFLATQLMFAAVFYINHWLICLSKNLP